MYCYCFYLEVKISSTRFLVCTLSPSLQSDLLCPRHITGLLILLGASLDRVLPSGVTVWSVFRLNLCLGRGAAGPPFGRIEQGGILRARSEVGVSQVEGVTEPWHVSAHWHVRGIVGGVIVALGERAIEIREDVAFDAVPRGGLVEPRSRRPPEMSHRVQQGAVGTNLVVIHQVDRSVEVVAPDHSVPV